MRERPDREDLRQEHPNARLARALWEAIAAGDGEAFQASLSDGASWEVDSAGVLNGEHKGNAEILSMLARSGEQVDSLRSTLLDVYASDHGAVLRYRLEAERGSEALETEMLIVCEIRDGQVTHAFSLPRYAARSERFWALP